jgi:hypothetical protein
MGWTDAQEKLWKEMTDEREKNKEDIGKNAFITSLRELADAVESGRKNVGDVEIEFIRGYETFGYPGEAPVIGRKVTVTVYF